MLKRKPKKQQTRALSRKGQAARIIEEKHVGRETTEWDEVENFDVAFFDTLRHYGYFYDLKDAHSWATDWMKIYRPDDLKDFRKAEYWRLSMTAGSMCKMQLNGAKFDAGRKKWLDRKIQEVVDFGKEKTESVESSDKKSPADIVKERTSEFIGQVEGVIDHWKEKEDYSVFDELKKVDAPYNIAKAIQDYYTPLCNEVELAVTKKDKQVVEAYSNMKASELKSYQKFLLKIVADAEKYQGIKKAVRKPRKKKTVLPVVQAAKVNYQKECEEYGLKSVLPSKIVGSKEVWLFNTKYRTINRLVSSSKDGFTIKGTTIQDVDLDKSSKKKLRKPEDFFKQDKDLSKTKLKAIYNDIKTKETPTTGRVGTETIIYRVF